MYEDTEEEIIEARKSMLIGGLLGLVLGLIILNYIYYLIGAGAFDFLFVNQTTYILKNNLF